MDFLPLRAADLLSFVDRHHDAPSFLHELVRRLLEVEGAAVEGFSSHEGLQAPGWDGMTRHPLGTAFVPEGRAFWELSAQRSDLSGKANRDYRKRSVAGSGDSAAVYVQLMLGRWQGKLAWEDSRTSEGTWREVVARDVDDLVSVLQKHPAVMTWAVERVGGVAEVVRASLYTELAPAPREAIDRDDVRRNVEHAVAPGQLVAVWGAPGMGKTWLVQEAARRISASYPDGVFYDSWALDDDESIRRDRLMRRVVRTLDSTYDGAMDISEAFAECVRSRRVLIVIDNARTEAEVQPFLGAPSASLLVSSRRRLSGFVDATHVEVGALPVEEGHLLLQQAATGTDDLTDVDLLDRIWTLCDGIPLALRIAGALARLNSRWGLRGVIAELEDRHRRLDTLVAGDRAVRAGFESVIETLPVDAATAFESIALIPGDLITAELLARATGHGSIRTSERHLRELREYALLTPMTEPGTYQVHDLLRVYIEERLAQSPPADEFQRRAAVINWLLEGLDRHAVPLMDSWQDLVNDAVPAAVAGELAWLVQYADSVIEAVGVAGDRLQEWRAAWVASLVLVPYLHREQRYADVAALMRRARRWIQAARYSAAPGEQSALAADHAMLILSEAHAVLDGGNHAEALRLLRLARRAAPAEFLVMGQLDTLEGHAHAGLGDYAAALHRYRKVAESTAHAPDSEPHTTARYNVGLTLYRLNRNAEALPYLVEELAAVRRRGDTHGEGVTLNTIGLVHLHSRRFADAIVVLAHASEALSSTRDRAEYANATHDLALAYLLQGNTVDARKYFLEEIDVRIELSDDRNIARTSVQLLELDYNEGITVAVADVDALIARIEDDLGWRASAYLLRARVHDDMNRAADATDDLLVALEGAREEPQEYVRFRLIRHIADILDRGDLDESDPGTPDLLDSILRTYRP